MASLEPQPSIAPDLRVQALMKLIARLDGIDLSPMLVYRIDSAPASAIPYLAWQFDVASPLWQLIEAIDQRSMIKAMAALHQTKGTPAAIKSALAALGWPQAQLLEGQQSWGGSSYPSSQGWAACRVMNRMGVTLSTYDLAVLALNPTAYWKLDDPGYVARDATPARRDLLGSPAGGFVSPGAAPLLGDGETSMSFSQGYHPPLFPCLTAAVEGVLLGPDTTVTAWVSLDPAALTPGNQLAIVSQRGWDGDDGWFGLNYDTGSPLGLMVNSYVSGQFYAPFPTDGAVHFVGYSTDGATTRIYVDGSLVARGSQPLVAGGATYFQVGWDRGTPGANWRGRIGRVATFSGVLTDAQIAALYQAGISSRAAAAVTPSAAPAAAPGLITAAFNFFKPARVWLDAVVFESAPQADAISSPADAASGFSGYFDITGVFDVLNAPRDSFSFTLPAASDPYALPLTYDKRSQHAGDSYANVRVGPSDGATTLNGNPVEGNR